MAKKPGYYVQGQFVAQGSELDLELNNVGGPPSKTELKRASTELQALGEALLTLSPQRLANLQLPEKLLDAVQEGKRISAFEGRRRHMQFIGKLMRGVDPEPIQAAVEAQHMGSAQDTVRLHQAERWRDELLADDAALARWMAEYAQTDTQALRALIRQARKDALPLRPGAAPRQGRAYRELFALIREHLLA